MATEERIDTPEEFSLLKRAKSFSYAGRGLVLFVKTTHNAWVHITLFLLVIGLGFYFDITRVEWIVLMVLGGIVLAAEAFNTAIEIDIDLTSPEYHPYARDTKDVAAGAVLIVAIMSAVVGGIIFFPYVSSFFASPQPSLPVTAPLVELDVKDDTLPTTRTQNALLSPIERENLVYATILNYFKDETPRECIRHTVVPDNEHEIYAFSKLSNEQCPYDLTSVPTIPSLRIQTSTGELEFMSLDGIFKPLVQ